MADGGHYAGFMPDFVLYLGSFGEIVQVYIEPKGEQLLERDQWKEDLLQSLNTSEVLVEDDNVRLLGVHFYVNGDARGVRDELRKRVL